MDENGTEHGFVGNRREILRGLTLGALAAGTAATGVLGGGALSRSLGRANAAEQVIKMAFIQYQPHTVSSAWSKGIEEVLAIQPGVRYQLLDGQAKADVQISLMDTVINDGVKALFIQPGIPWFSCGQITDRNSSVK